MCTRFWCTTVCRHTAYCFHILNFEKDFADAAVVKLEQNYRSTGHILKAATAVVRTCEISIIYILCPYLL